MTKTQSNVASSALNRLIVACHDEEMALDSAARVMDGSEQKTRLQRQSRRRAVFLGDLSAGVVGLGRTPMRHASYAARLSGAMTSVRALVTGPHEGDAYVACSRAADRTALAYSTVLDLDLPSDVRFGVERQYKEIRSDCRELRRLSWGAGPIPVPVQRAKQQNTTNDLSYFEDGSSEFAFDSVSDSESDVSLSPRPTAAVLERPEK